MTREEIAEKLRVTAKKWSETAKTKLPYWLTLAEAVLPEPWTDDDQRALNAAIADAMWYWDDMPMDPDDAISLTGILKECLQENGFQIVRAPLEKNP